MKSRILPGHPPATNCLFLCTIHEQYSVHDCSFSSHPVFCWVILLLFYSSFEHALFQNVVSVIFFLHLSCYVVLVITFFFFYLWWHHISGSQPLNLQAAIAEAAFKCSFQNQFSHCGLAFCMNWGYWLRVSFSGFDVQVLAALFLAVTKCQKAADGPFCHVYCLIKNCSVCVEILQTLSDYRKMIYVLMCRQFCSLH